MTPFDYTSVLSSIIVGLALTDILVSLHRLLRAGRRVRWDWAAPAGAALVVLTLVQMWWLLYGPTDTTVTIGQFLPLLVELVLLFLLASSALPDRVPDDGLDLKAYYDRNGPYFWTLFALALGWITISEGAGVGHDLDALLNMLANRAADLIALGVLVSLIFVRKRWWHAIGFLLLSTGPILWLTRSL
jgi:hypothetical protein